MENLELTQRQQERLEQIKSLLQSTPNQDITPTTLVDSWEPAPETHTMEWETSKRWVHTSNIVGTVKMNIERCDARRMLKHIERIERNDFDLKHPCPPALKQVDGEFYVDADGNHRVLLFKSIGVNKIWAEVVRYY